MMSKRCRMLIVTLLLAGGAAFAQAAEGEAEAAEASEAAQQAGGEDAAAGPGGGPDIGALEQQFEEQEAEVRINDPLEPVNRIIGGVNDRFIIYVLDPVAKGYRHVVPEKGREGIGNFFHNLGAPIRVVNNTLQGKFGRAGKEVKRFALNTTAGGLGFRDVAGEEYGMERYNEDLGQTFAKAGAPHGLYIVLPLLGPTSLRDGIGRFGDGYLHPVHYLEWEPAVGARATSVVNEHAFRIGRYQELKQSAADPYILFRNAYVQRRARQVEE